MFHCSYHTNVIANEQLSSNIVKWITCKYRSRCGGKKGVNRRKIEYELRKKEGAGAILGQNWTRVWSVRIKKFRLSAERSAEHSLSQIIVFAIVKNGLTQLMFVWPLIWTEFSWFLYRDQCIIGHKRFWWKEKKRIKVSYNKVYKE